MAKTNPPIGTCECPVKGCTDSQVPVYRYRSRSDNPALRRHAGKLYLVCPTHGKSEAQEWILEHATITNNDAAASTATAAKDGKDAADQAAGGDKRKEPKTSPAATEESKAGTWGFFS